MHFSARLLLAMVITVGTTGTAFADDDIEGVIEWIDPTAGTLSVMGITFQTTPGTEYDDGLHRFEDLQPGQHVEVEFDYRDGIHVAKEIELDD